MNGIAELFVALTCHGNSVLRGNEIPHFFPENTACQFCEFVRFYDGTLLSETPDEWFSRLRRDDTLGLVLTRAAKNYPHLPDRETAGFVGGGGTMHIEAIGKDLISIFWRADWTVGNQRAADRRIWRVDCAADHRAPTQPHSFRSLHAIAVDFEKALTDIQDFSRRQFGNDGFTACFAAALKLLRDPAKTGEQRSYLFPPHILSRTAERLMAAAGPAWVFGGMGSWNDVSFERREDQETYDRVSEALFRIINEATTTAASSSWKESGLSA
jgi:hypothetical protein